MESINYMPALIETVCDTIKQSLESFSENEPLCNSKELSSELVSVVSNGLHDCLMEGGRAGLVEFIERHDSVQDKLERNGKSYTFKQTDSKEFLVIFGPISVRRRRYCHWSGGPSIVPLDEDWEMNGRYVTPEVTEQLLLAASMMTPSETEELVGRMCPYRPSASLVQDLIAQDGAALGKFLADEDHEERMRPLPPLEEEASALVVSMDGVNVLLRERGKKPGRPAERPGQGPKKAAGSCCYKNAMVGSISYYKQVEGVLDIETGEEATVPERIHSIYHARMPEECALTFKEEFERLVARAESELPDGVPKILLMDGARPLWNYAQRSPQFAEYRMLVDFYHSSEHLSKLAESLFGKNSSKGAQWYENWRHKLKHEEGAVDGMLRSVQRYLKLNKLSKAGREDVEKERTFFKRNRERLNYHEFVAAALPIGSGPVEAACKTVVKARFCQSGMRWSNVGGQNVLNLRVLHKSNQWDAAWAHYRESGGFNGAQRLDDDRAAA